MYLSLKAIRKQTMEGEGALIAWLLCEVGKPATSATSLIIRSLTRYIFRCGAATTRYILGGVKLYYKPGGCARCTRIFSASIMASARRKSSCLLPLSSR